MTAITKITMANGETKFFAFEDKGEEMNNYIAWCLANNGTYTYENGTTIYADKCASVEALNVENNANNENEEYDEYKALSNRAKEIEMRLSLLNENSTLKEFAEIRGLMDGYSDFYKDVNYVRPHFNMYKWGCLLETKTPQLAEQWEKLDSDTQLELMYK